MVCPHLSACSSLFNYITNLKFLEHFITFMLWSCISNQQPYNSCFYCFCTSLICHLLSLTHSVALQPWRAQAAVNTVS
jgi:hypothetical protein